MSGTMRKWEIKYQRRDTSETKSLVVDAGDRMICEGGAAFFVLAHEGYLAGNFMVLEEIPRSRNFFERQLLRVEFHGWRIIGVQPAPNVFRWCLEYQKGTDRTNQVFIFEHEKSDLTLKASVLLFKDYVMLRDEDNFALAYGLLEPDDKYPLQLTCGEYVFKKLRKIRRSLKP